MPFADPRTRLEHILEAIREIEGFVRQTLQDYLGQGWLRFATQRGIEIVSEAVAPHAGRPRSQASRDPVGRYAPASATSSGTDTTASTML